MDQFFDLIIDILDFSYYIRIYQKEKQMKRIAPRSILDNDTYKITMQNAICNLYPNSWVKYTFNDRDDRTYPEGFETRLREEVHKMSTVRLEEGEAQFLREKCPFINESYIDFLKSYRFNPNEVRIRQEEGKLSITIEGYWYKTVLWEVPLLAMISELLNEMTGQDINTNDDEFGGFLTRLNDYDLRKLKYINECGAKIADFGTRRRHSYQNHKRFISIAKEMENSPLVGTSNVHFAHIFDLNPIGTFAHEWVMGIGAVDGYAKANKNAMENWVKVYNGQLGIALTDTFGTDSFFKDFDTKYAKLFDGVRHDSGDEFEFVEKTIENYKKLGIDPKTKTIVFSDGLKPEKIHDLQSFTRGRIKASFGVGTNLTNDVGFDAANIVIKLREIDDQPAVKLSEDNGKHTGDPGAIESIKYLLNYNGKRDESS